MSTHFISLLILASASLLAFWLFTFIYEHLLRYRLTVRERLKVISGESSDEALSIFKGIQEMPDAGDPTRELWPARVERLVAQAGVKWSPIGVAARCLGCCAVTALIGLYWGWWLCAASAPLGGCVPLCFVYVRRHTRRRRLSRQLPEAFEMISRAVRAGQTIPAALQIVAQDFDPPIRDEFALCYEQQNLGISRESAFRQLAKRTGTMELQMFVVALLVQAKSGGDLVELLDNLSATVRKRLKLKDRVRALTGEGRMQALVLIVLPVLALLGVIVLSPDYAQSLFDRPWLLAGTAAAQLVGALWVRQIVNFDF